MDIKPHWKIGVSLRYYSGCNDLDDILNANNVAISNHWSDESFNSFINNDFKE